MFVGRFSDAVRKGEIKGLTKSSLFRMILAYFLSVPNLGLLLNRRFVITTSWFWKQVFESATRPADLQELVEALMGVRPSSREQLRRSAEKLYSEIMETVASSGVSVEARDLMV